MHDPMTVAFDIKSPLRGKPTQFWPEGYRNTLITIWHVDPEADGSDDSCGWFKRARHGDQKIRQNIRKAFAGEWVGEHIGWFHESGFPKQSVQATVLAMFQRAAHVYFNRDWVKAHAFMQRNLFALIMFAENNTDSLYESITQKYGPTPRADRVEEMADLVFAWILRAEQKWYQQARWHIWHWKIQVHALQSFKRWAFSRCATCGHGFAWGESPRTNQWNGTGPRWFRGEHDVHHLSCGGHGVGTQKHGATTSASAAK